LLLLFCFKGFWLAYLALNFAKAKELKGVKIETDNLTKFNVGTIIGIKKPISFYNISFSFFKHLLQKKFYHE